MANGQAQDAECCVECVHACVAYGGMLEMQMSQEKIPEQRRNGPFPEKLSPSKLASMCITCEIG